MVVRVKCESEWNSIAILPTYTLVSLTLNIN